MSRVVYLLLLLVLGFLTAVLRGELRKERRSSLYVGIVTFTISLIGLLTVVSII